MFELQIFYICNIDRIIALLYNTRQNILFIRHNMDCINLLKRKLKNNPNFNDKGAFFMAKTNGAQTIETIPGRRVILSGAVGKTNVDELKWLSETILAEIAPWKQSGWAYVADCSQMLPIGATESTELVKMTKSFVDAGCKAFAFAEGSSLMLKVQAKKNTEMSQTGVLEAHFETREEALDWLKEELNI